MVLSLLPGERWRHRSGHAIRVKLSCQTVAEGRWGQSLGLEVSLQFWLMRASTRSTARSRSCCCIGYAQTTHEYLYTIV
jgi:hypothetical protein